MGADRFGDLKPMSAIGPGVALDVDWRTTLAGFLGALAVLGILVGFVGAGAIVAALATADPEVLTGVLIVAVAWLSAWGLSLRTVLGVLETAISVRLAVLLFTAATFANNVTPFGQAGGEPVTALLITHATDAEYETSLAAIASVDSLNFVPSTTLALIGIGFFSAEVAFGRRLQVAALAVGSLALIIPAIGFVAWRNRYRVERAVVRALTPAIAVLARLRSGYTPTEGDIARRIEGFFRAIERVAGDREQVALALGFSTLGWLFLAGSLWLSLFALGYDVPYSAMLVVVPVGAIAGVTPLPGGLGGVETVLVAMLVPTTQVTVPVATAAVLLHRGATYWLPTIVGGGVAAGLGAHRRL